ncbi:MAG TPA: hypothetical protein VNG35_11345 [Gemmatimonadales bacterium]|nr:hypothetical protein [Gemmatimonadales bacterium]
MSAPITATMMTSHHPAWTGLPPPHHHAFDRVDHWVGDVPHPSSHGAERRDLARTNKPRQARNDRRQDEYSQNGESNDDENRVACQVSASFAILACSA